MTRERIVRDFGLEVGRHNHRSIYVRCVFHQEKTPSLVLYEDHFHCYGCQHHGSFEDLIRFLEPEYDFENTWPRDIPAGQLKLFEQPLNPNRKSKWAWR